MNGPILAVDTATRRSVVVVGAEAPQAVSRREVRHQHGTYLLAQIDEVLAEAGLELGDVGALAVGTGPGSFTGLRVGLATIKTIAYARGLPLVGVRSSDALRAAAADEQVAVVLPAGAHDHYLVRAGSEPLLVTPGGLIDALAGDGALCVDLPPDVLGAEAVARGVAAETSLPAALLALARARLASGDVDDVATLTPAYVALPRGVRRAAEDLGWSPDLR